MQFCTHRNIFTFFFFFWGVGEFSEAEVARVPNFTCRLILFSFRKISFDLATPLFLWRRGG